MKIFSPIIDKEINDKFSRIDDVKHNFKNKSDAEKFVDEYQITNNSKFSVYKTGLEYDTIGILFS